MNNWELENVEEKAKENPDRFFIPTIQERKSQKIGDVVRLHFILTEKEPELPRAERIWVKILEISNDGNNFKGYLTNQPRYIKGLKAGDIISFLISNIAQVITKKTDPGWVECGEKKALISENCFKQGGIIRFIYREKPDRDEDSGWRFLSAEESNAEMNDPGNVRLCNVYWLLDRDPTLLEVVKEGKYGDVFEREGKGQPWRKVVDWIPGE